MLARIVYGAAITAALIAPQVVPVAASEASAGASLPLPRLAEIVEEAARNGLSGAVIVAHHGRPVLERSYGLANWATGEMITPDTQFALASLNKFITRLAIFQLLQAGKLQLSDPVGKHLPDLPNDDLKRKVTIQHLLDMKGGVPSFWNARYFNRRKEIRTTGDYLDLFVREPLRFEPGTKREYSNGGFVVLGAIIERLSSTSYEQYVRTHISGPAGMRRTGLFPHHASTKGRAVGYTFLREDVAAQMRSPATDRGSAGGVPVARGTSLRANSDTLALRGSSAGGGYSTVRDLLRLDQAIRSGKLLKPEFTDLFAGPGFGEGRGRPTGWNGGAPGQNVQFIMYPDGITVIVLTNQDPPAASRLANAIVQALGKTNPFG